MHKKTIKNLAHFIDTLSKMLLVIERLIQR